MPLRRAALHLLVALLSGVCGCDGSAGLAPEEGRIVFSRLAPGEPLQIATVRPDGTGLRVLTTGPGMKGTPAWSPDRALIAFAATDGTDAVFRLHVMRADGTELRRITAGPASDSWPAWSPDGSRIVFQRSVLGEGTGLSVIGIDGTGLAPVTPLAGFADSHPAWSPDGRRIAFASYRDGTIRLYTVAPDGTDLAPVNVDMVGEFPAWSRDGRRLAFSTPESNGFWNIAIAEADGSVTILPWAESGSWRRLRPAWSPDETRFASMSDNFDGRVTVMRADGRDSLGAVIAHGLYPSWR